MRDGCTPDSVIKFGCEMNIRSMHGENSNICAGSLITWCKPNCDEILSIVYLQMSSTSPHSKRKLHLKCR